MVNLAVLARPAPAPAVTSAIAAGTLGAQFRDELGVCLYFLDQSGMRGYVFADAPMALGKFRGSQ